MTTLQKLAAAYALLFFSVVALGYIPGFTYANGALFGLFYIEPRDDVLHLASGLWAAFAAWRSYTASRFYFRWFGAFYTLDAFVGFFTGYAILELALGNFDANAGYSFYNVTQNILVNLPHFIIGPIALFFGYVVGKSKNSTLIKNT